MVKKVIAEFLGTAFLVFMGCLAATQFDYGLYVFGVALAFGLTLTVLAYCLGGLSGCHVNPAVSLAMLISGRMSVADFCAYILAQFAGGFAGSACILLMGNPALGLGANEVDLGSFAVNPATVPAFLLEAALTLLFVYTVLRVTSEEKFAAVAPVGVGLALALVHLVGIPFTGTSVNPARSLAPAVLSGVDSEPFAQLGIFLLAPLLGGALAGIAFHFTKPKKS